MTDSILLCYCTCPDAESAQHIARTLVEERLAACVNRLPGVASTYRWDGRVTTDAEELLLIKTAATRFEALRERLLALHPYDVPELVAVEAGAGLPEYLAWVRNEVG